MHRAVPPVPHAHALRLRLLGSLELTQPDGTPIASVLTQPKRLALLVYLVLGNGSFQRRDVLLNLFWSEFDQERARAALRKALYFLRQSLGEGVLISRGDEEVGIAAERLWCDVRAFSAAVAVDQHEVALDLYRGELLAGFFVSGEGEFEKWLDAERGRLRMVAARCAAALTEQAEGRGDFEHALQHAETALTLEAHSEPAFRRLVAVLHRSNNRAGIARAYESWRNHLKAEYGIEPSAETQAMVAALLEADAADARSSAGGRPGLTSSFVLPRTRLATRARNGWAWSAAVLVVALVLGAAVFASRSPGLAPKRVLVTVFENRTGNPGLTPVGLMAADWIANGLMQTGNVEVISSTTLTAQGEKRPGLREIAGQVGAGTVISGSYYLDKDSLQLQAQITDVIRNRLLHVVTAAGVSVDSATAAIDVLKQRVSAALAARFDWPSEWTELTQRAQPPTYDAYAAYVDGWAAFSRVLFGGPQQTVQAAERFERAYALDSTFHLAQLYAVLMHYNLGRSARADSLLTAAARYRDRMPPVERVLLDRLEAVRARDVEGVFQTAQQMNRIAPNSMLTGYVVAAVAANRPREALKAHARRNLSDSILKGEALYWRWLATARHMVGDYQQELEETRLRREEQPELMGPLFVEARALAGLGRVADVERVLEETLTMPRQDFTPGAVMLHTAVELRAHGHRDAAVRVLAKALAWHATRPPAARRALRETLARTYYEAEQWDAARPVFEELAREEPRNIMYLGYLGALAARRGDRREVERITARLAAVPDSQQLPNQLLWRARMAALLGTPDQALELLREAIAEGLRYDLWLHTDRDLDSLREYGAFKKLARPRG